MDYFVLSYLLSIPESHSFSGTKVLEGKHFVSFQSNVIQPAYCLRVFITEKGVHLISHMYMYVDFFWSTHHWFERHLFIQWGLIIFVLSWSTARITDALTNSYYNWDKHDKVWNGTDAQKGDHQRLPAGHFFDQATVVVCWSYQEVSVSGPSNNGKERK